jgi:HD-GYP domain-containing protein (c-di-GMP phosphodiesterase class II)
LQTSETGNGPFSWRDCKVDLVALGINSPVCFCMKIAFPIPESGVPTFPDAERRSVVAHDRMVRDYRQIAEQLDRAYEELSLLRLLIQNAQVVRTAREVAELALERMIDILQVEGLAIWNSNEDDREFLVQGVMPIDEQGLARLVSRFESHAWPRPLVRNQIAGTLLGADFPGLKSFVLLPISDGSKKFGWILACNGLHGALLGTVEAGLISSVASILATHQCNLALCRQQEGLLLCFVRSLVSSLDAKDPYTRGHSERVARIAQRLGARLGLPKDDLRDIYLAGLLHDIGKIGVDDQILRKPGQLTKEEFELVKKHPVIGYNILAGLDNLRNTLPGVRHHHEAYSGRGYPDGLAGNEIPFIARILAVADSFDAMLSDRPYRSGLKLEKLEAILREGSGQQWDPIVVDAYFAVSHDILQIYAEEKPLDRPACGTQELRLVASETDPLEAVERIRGALQAVAEI